MLATPAGARANPGNDARQYAAWKTEAARTLAAREDANSQATAAVLLYVTPSLESRARAQPWDLVTRAARIAPTNRAIGWLSLRICEGTLGCDVPDAATTVRWLDADNAAAWLPTMALGKRFDIYWNPAIVMMFDTLKSAAASLPRGRAETDALRYQLVLDIAAATLTPTLTPLANACREGSGPPQRHESCMKVGAIMQAGDTLSVQSLAYSIQTHLAPPETKLGRNLAERRKALDWRRGEFSKFGLPFLPWSKNRWALRRMDLMRQYSREEDLMIAVLREHRVPLDPPANTHTCRPAPRTKCLATQNSV
jgi:hypothetical protein